MAPQMEKVSEELILPSSPTPQSLKCYKISHLDQLLLTCHIPFILFYPNPLDSNLDPAQTSQHLKQSLSKVLTHFYPLAGRINVNSSVDCNDSGVPFVEARVQAQLSQAIQNVVELEELDQYLPSAAYPGGKIEVNEDVPLAVKISFFECGGTAIGVNLSHKIADVLSLATFLNAWTATCRGETEIVLPNFDLAARHFPPVDNTPSPELVPDENVVMKRFVFDKEKIGALRAQASSASEEKNFSRVQLVVAYIWKHVIDVTRAKYGAKNKFVVVQAVNLRSRMNPPLPHYAMGNIATLLFAAVDAEWDKDFPDLIGPLRTSLEKTEDDHNHELLKGMTCLYELEPQELLSFTSWCRLGFYDLDFGWGKPLSACTTTFPKRNAALLMDTRSGDGVEAWLPMAEDEMAMLPVELLSLVDSDFSK